MNMTTQNYLTMENKALAEESKLIDKYICKIGK